MCSCRKALEASQLVRSTLDKAAEYHPYPVSLASVYTTLTAEGMCQIGWELYSPRLEDQKLSSSLASEERVSISHQAHLDSNTAYKLRVMNLLMGPNSKPMEVILPTILARVIALI